MAEVMDQEVVCFYLGNEEYGIDIARVQEIIRLLKLTRLPGTEDFFLGIINLRGSIIPIIDLKKKFTFFDSEITDDTRVIVIEFGAQRVGIIVDEVAEVLKIPAGSMVPAEAIGAQIAAQYLLGVTQIADRMLILLNVDRLMD